MSTMNRRRFSLLGLGGFASAVLVACGNDIGDEKTINPTKIPDVPGAPKPTLADMATPGGSDPESGGEATGGGEVNSEVTVVSTEFKFTPAEFSIAPGGTVTLRNDGAIPHDWAVEAFGGDVIPLTNSGESATYTIPENTELGEYEFYCTVAGHKDLGMVGKITVAEAGSAPAGGDASPPAEGGATPVGAEQPAGEVPAGGAPAGGPVTVTSSEFKFDPATFTAAPGTEITLHNAGVIPHDFAIDALGGAVIPLTDGGAENKWTIPADAAPGDYEFYCTVAGHKDLGMVGTLTIG